MELIQKYEERLSVTRSGNLERDEELKQIELYLSQRLFELSIFWSTKSAYVSVVVNRSRICEFEKDLTTCENILMSKGLLDEVTS